MGDSSDNLYIITGTNATNLSVTDYYGWNVEFNTTHSNGLSLEERLETIEMILGLPKRDTELEEKHPHLKKMYDEHVELCKIADHASNKYKEETEKLRTFEILKTE
jgi:hypothetical protein